MSARLAQIRQSQRQQSRGVVGIGSRMLSTALKCASLEPLSDHQRTELMMPIYALLERLRTGILDLEDFDALTESNAFAFTLAAEIHKHGTDDTKAIIAPSEADIMAGADALNQIGTRYSKTGKFGASANELTALRQSFVWLDQMLSVCNEGTAYRAMREAARMVAQMREQLRIARRFKK